MPIRVMSWNIDKFNSATLDRTDFNEWYILEAITAQQHDIVVLLEVQSTQGNIGSLIDGPGRDGVLTLLASLRAEDGASDWRLVPPVRLNDNGLGAAHTEGIAVFYRNASVTFTGPRFFAGAGVVAVNGGPGVAYGGAWANALPGGNQFAPRITWTDNNGGTINFPNANKRPPMLTRFTEIANGRTIRLLSMHLPPRQAQAAEALSMVSSIPVGQLGALGAPDVAIAIGDINYDLNGNSTVLAATRYGHFRNGYAFRGFQMAQGSTRIADRADGGIGLMVGGSRRYQWVTNLQGNTVRTYVDNAYVRYGANGAPMGAAYNPTVADMVAGTGPYATTMARTIADIDGQAFYNKDTLFRMGSNYGHVARWAGVSDHLPIVIDVP